MGIQDTNKVDIIAINKDNGMCTLTIIDSLEWTDEKEHLFLLQEKLNVYLSYIESGEIYSTYPASKDKEFEINICFRFSIPESCVRFIQQVSKIISNAGFTLSYSIG